MAEKHKRSTDGSQLHFEFVWKSMNMSGGWLHKKPNQELTTCINLELAAALLFTVLLIWMLLLGISNFFMLIMSHIKPGRLQRFGVCERESGVLRVLNNHVHPRWHLLSVTWKDTKSFQSMGFSAMINARRGLAVWLLVDLRLVISWLFQAVTSQLCTT